MFCWTLHQKGSPQKACVAVAVSHEVYYFGENTDENDEKKIDVQVFNTVSLRWRKLTPAVTPGRAESHLEVPSGRHGYTAVLIGDIVYFWGGREYNIAKYCNLLYAFDVDAHRWFKPQVSGTVPSGRENHSACVLGKVMYIHGGWTQNGLTKNMYKVDTSTMVWSLNNTRGIKPPASYCHSATIIGTKMFVFGGWGRDDDIVFDTFRVFDTETNLWLSTASTQLLPGGRYNHSAFAYNGELYIFGGHSDDDSYDGWDFNDLWKFSPETFSWKEVEPKGEGLSTVSRMCCCMVGDRIFLFGGKQTPDDMDVLDFSPSLKTLCKLAVIQYSLEKSELPHNIRWELEAMTTNSI